MAINCAALTESLLESELFGHEKGSFTGAVGQKKGKIEVADKGTLFLDEISELAPALQAKLLRVLQEREFERVGGTKPLKVDVRLIAATNKSLPEAAQQGRFRADLYYRLNVVTINMPPLRERREDIPALALSFLEKFSKKGNTRRKELSPEALTALMQYEWPGNVRELENAIQRAIIDAPGRTIRVCDLNLTYEDESPSEDHKILDFGDYLPTGNFEKQLREYKIRLALAAVRENNGNKALAARSLGMSRAYLYRLIGLAESETQLEQNITCSIKV
jgi:transcriptional regulator with GAF, ATPase, and Fis domain